MNALRRPTDFFSEREIAPYGVNYHLEHHLVVNCPYYRLKRAHRMLLAKGMASRMEVRGSYRDMLAVAVSG